MRGSWIAKQIEIDQRKEKMLKEKAQKMKEIKKKSNQKGGTK